MRKTVLMMFAFVATFIIGQSAWAYGQQDRNNHQQSTQQGRGKGYGHNNGKGHGYGYGHGKKDSTSVDSTRNHRGFGYGFGKKDSTSVDSTRNHRGFGHGFGKKDSTAVDSTRNHRGFGYGFGHGFGKKDSTSVDSTRNHRGFGHGFGQGHKGFGFGKGHKGGMDFRMKADSFYVDNALYMDTVNVGVGATTAVLPIALRNDSTVKSVYFCLELPEGITLAKDAEGKYMVELNSTRATEAHKVYTMPGRKDNVTFRCSSQTDAYVGNAGIVAYVTVNLDENLEAGEYSIQLKNVGMKDANDKRHKTATSGSAIIIGAQAVKALANDANAIKGVAQDKEAVRYDLNGRNVKTANGQRIYIQNGRKYVK